MTTPPALDLPRRNLLLVGSGALPVSLLPGWVMCLRDWYPVTVRLCLTWSATRLVSPAALAAVSGQPVLGPDWQPETGRVDHREAADWADLVLVAPATGNVVAKAAAGITDSLALAVIAFTTAPVVVVPSLAAPVAASQACRRNLRQLTEDGFQVMPTTVGLSAHSGEEELGAMPSIGDVLRFAAAVVADPAHDRTRDQSASPVDAATVAG